MEWTTNIVDAQTGRVEVETTLPNGEVLGPWNSKLDAAAGILEAAQDGVISPGQWQKLTEELLDIEDLPDSVITIVVSESGSPNLGFDTDPDLVDPDSVPGMN